MKILLSRFSSLENQQTRHTKFQTPPKTIVSLRYANRICTLLQEFKKRTSNDRNQVKTPSPLVVAIAPLWDCCFIIFVSVHVLSRFGFPRIRSPIPGSRKRRAPLSLSSTRAHTTAHLFTRTPAHGTNTGFSRRHRRRRRDVCFLLDADECVVQCILSTASDTYFSFSSVTRGFNTMRWLRRPDRCFLEKKKRIDLVHSNININGRVNIVWYYITRALGHCTSPHIGSIIDAFDRTPVWPLRISFHCGCDALCVGTDFFFNLPGQ